MKTDKQNLTLLEINFQQNTTLRKQYWRSKGGTLYFVRPSAVRVRQRNEVAIILGIILVRAECVRGP